MKRAVLMLVLLVLVVVLLFLVIRQRQVKQDESRDLFCTRLEEQKKSGREPSVTPAYKWAWRQNQRLAVYFDGGASDVKMKVLRVANEWANYCGMSFADTSGSWAAQIRVSFRGKEYASAVGKECLETGYIGKPTMYLGGLDTMRNETNFRRIVLHEFGHALGLEHELKNPNLRIPWDTPAVYKYYKDHYRWNEARVQKNIFKALAIDQYKRYDEFDSTSIMIYALPDTLTKGRLRLEWPINLSQNDKAGIAAWYPKSLPE